MIVKTTQILISAFDQEFKFFWPLTGLFFICFNESYLFFGILLFVRPLSFLQKFDKTFHDEN